MPTIRFQSAFWNKQWQREKFLFSPSTKAYLCWLFSAFSRFELVSIVSKSTLFINHPFPISNCTPVKKQQSLKETPKEKITEREENNDSFTSFLLRLGVAKLLMVNAEIFEVAECSMVLCLLLFHGHIVFV